jgi:uncharacterized repeat protein (TIGR02543 family)
MKKILAALLLLALVAPAMADVAVTAADLGGGHLRITVSPSAGAGVRGVALVLENTDGATVASTAAVTATGLNTFVDYAMTAGTGYTAVGQGHPGAKWNLPGGEAAFPADSAKFSLCAGYLDENGVDPKGEAYMVDSFFDVFFTQGSTSTATIAISLDTIRGGIVGDTLGTVTVQASQTLTFVVNYTLAMSAGTGGVLEVDNSGVYAAGTVVDIKSTPNAGYTFAGWTGDTTNIANAALEDTTITMNADATIVATFAEIPEAITQPTVTKTTAAPAIGTRVNSGRVETFVASGAVNNKGHAMEYLFIWGDTPVNTTWGPATQTHTYTYGGAGIVKTTPYAYNVTVQARCIAHPTVVSPVSPVLALTSEPVKSTATTVYAAYNTLGRPDCWAFQRNCKGDVNGVGTGGGVSKVWVNSTDLGVFSAAYNKPQSVLLTVNVGGVMGACADNERAGTGGGVSKVWVNSTDLGTFSGNYNKPQSLVPVCVQTNYHYWTN